MSGAPFSQLFSQPLRQLCACAVPAPALFFAPSVGHRGSSILSSVQGSSPGSHHSAWWWWRGLCTGAARKWPPNSKEDGRLSPRTLLGSEEQWGKWGTHFLPREFLLKGASEVIAPRRGHSWMCEYAGRGSRLRPSPRDPGELFRFHPPPYATQPLRPTASSGHREDRGGATALGEQSSARAAELTLCPAPCWLWAGSRFPSGKVAARGWDSPGPFPSVPKLG